MKNDEIRFLEWYFKDVRSFVEIMGEEFQYHRYL